jgi:hypothetical protein
MKKEKPVKRRNIHMNGNVVRSRLRRPNVSIVYTAGIAKSQLTIPVPRETRRALDLEKLASMKIWVL